MSKISDLAQTLHIKTMERKIKWEIADDSSITTSVGTNSITISSLNSLNNENLYHMYIENLDGKTVDEEFFYQNEAVYKIIREMMVRARRDSLRADETLDELMEKISKL